jgi:hypothetical protein
MAHLVPFEEILAARRRTAVVMTPDADLRHLQGARHRLGDLANDGREIIRRAHIAAHQCRE